MSGSVSIIVPTRNRAAVLSRCLEALVQQQTGTYQCEVIVVDDCSADDTPARVRALATSSSIPVRLLRQPRPSGANSARNLAVANAQGEILVFLDDDVLVPPGWLEKLVGGLTPSGSQVVTGAVRLTAEGAILGKHRNEVGSFLSEVLEPARGLRGEIVPVACNMAAYHSLFEANLFDETLRPPIEEIDWLHRAGVSAAFLPEAWVWHLKLSDELRLSRVLRGAWHRGSEGGWWMRARVKMPFRERLPLALKSAKTCVRSLGHAVLQRCSGGIVIGFAEFAKALALVGLINRGARVPQSWR